MFRQNEHHVSDASIKSQTRSGILTPASDNSLNDGFGGKKRKRDGNTMDDLLKDTFIARVSVESAFGQLLANWNSHILPVPQQDHEYFSPSFYYLERICHYPPSILQLLPKPWPNPDCSRPMSKYLNWRIAWGPSQWL